MAFLKDSLRDWAAKIGTGARSSKGKDVLLYLMFVIVAFVFWMLLSLDNEVQRDFDIPLELNEVPDSVTIVSALPPSVNVSVKGKGSQLLRFLLSRSMPALKIKFEPTQGRDNQIYIGRQRLEARLREYFGNTVTIASCKPDSLKLFFTSRPGKKIKLEIDADVHTSLQYIISGPIKASVDSVTVYSVDDLPHNLTKVKTESIVRSGLKDTTRFDVRVHPIAGARIIPEHVTVTVPVEPLIAKKRVVTIQQLNVPAGYNLILFPSKIEISYLVPISEYSSDIPITVYVDYSSLKRGMTKLPLTFSIAPDAARNISLAADSVEYIIEKTAP